jgi:flagellar biosynthetic protein FliR
MSWIAQINPSLVIVFTLVLSRVSGLVAAAPLAGMQQVPMQVRALIVLALALLLSPAQLAGEFSAPDNLVEFALLVSGELFVGLLLGLGLQFLFAGIQIAGQLISQASGLTLADAFNPELNAEVPLFSQLMHLVAMALFVTLGGQRQLIAALLSTFESLPLGGIAGIPSVGNLIVTLIGESFALGLKVAAPCVVALLLTTLVMGLVGRTLPQLNIMSFGFGANSLVTLAMLSISISALLWTLDDQIEPWLREILAGLEAAIQ